jgi:hypothetical protein
LRGTRRCSPRPALHLVIESQLIEMANPNGACGCPQLHQQLQLLPSLRRWWYWRVAHTDKAWRMLFYSAFDWIRAKMKL